MDYYSILGLQKNASDAEIKKAYRSLAMKHHPDRGGDEDQFKRISEAYEVLSNADKRRMYDMGADPRNASYRSSQGHPFDFDINSANFGDIFSRFGFNNRQRNKDVRVRVAIDLEDVLTGKTIDAEIGMAGGVKKPVSINIPAGIRDNQQIQYQGMGDDSIRDLPPGNLIVGVVILPHQHFVRDGNKLICEKTISAWDAILGTEVRITTLDQRKLMLRIPRGTQPDTMLSCSEEGLPDIETGRRGNLLIKIKVEIPRRLSVDQLKRIEELKDEL